MPCYAVTPNYRRNVHHFNPFGPVSIVPRFSAPFFRSLEDDLAQFDSFFKEINASVAAETKKSFQPRFDVKEESDSFVLSGELPGVQPENLSIEFVNQNTLVVKGKLVRQETLGTPPATESAPAEKVQEESFEEYQDVTMSGAASDTVSQQTSSNFHKASVEDEGADNNNNDSSSTAKVAEGQEVTQAPAQQEVEQPTTQPQSRYWVSERTVGEFSRAFKFPGKVNQDGVKAALKDGLLTVSVPKAVEVDHRRKIEVNGQ